MEKKNRKKTMDPTKEKKKKKKRKRRKTLKIRTKEKILLN